MTREDEPARARRRRDLVRMKAKARRFYRDKPAAHKWADYLAVCSCWMCGNPRRYERAVTMQEKRWMATTLDDAGVRSATSRCRPRPEPQGGGGEGDPAQR